MQHQSINQSINQPTNQPTNQYACTAISFLSSSACAKAMHRTNQAWYCYDLLLLLRLLLQLLL